MKKAIFIIITLLLLVAVLWFVLNKEKITVLEDGIKMQPVHIVATWDSSQQMYVSLNGEEAYKECSCTNEECKYLPEELFVVHMYVIHNGSWRMYDGAALTDYIDLDGNLCIDAIRLSDRIENISRRFEINELNKPTLPEEPKIEDYVGNNDDTLKEIVSFFQWLADAFMYFFEDIVAYIINSVRYYFNYITIVFEELAV